MIKKFTEILKEEKNPFNLVKTDILDKYEEKWVKDSKLSAVMYLLKATTKKEYKDLPENVKNKLENLYKSATKNNFIITTANILRLFRDNKLLK